MDDDLREEMDEFDALSPEDPDEDELSPEFVSGLVDKIMKFNAMFVGHALHPYQEPLGRRIVESVLINDGEEVTALAARQSGKTETVSDIVATLMVLMPRLAKIYPDLLGRYREGFWVGMFAPVEGQVETMFSRTVTRLTSERAKEIMLDPEINDKPARKGGVVKSVVLANSGSFVSMMTANPRAKIESRTFHLIIIDECQEADDYVVSKSIAPMLAYHAGTMVKTGTPTTKKNNFYRSIQLNRRRQNAKKGAKQNHFQWDWKDVSKVNPNYERFIRKEMLRIGEDSDEFQMSYCPTPETRILTADLRHVPAGEITVGQELIGFDEDRSAKGQHRRLRKSVVESVGRLSLPCYRMTLSDGTTVTCSSDHKWLVTTAGRRTEWKRTGELALTDRIFKVTEVWEHAEDYRTGYLAAAYDGEGHLSRGTMLGFSQRDNPMMLKVRKYLEELGFRAWEVGGYGTNRDVSVLHIAGGRSEVMRFLGQVRPERLLDKWLSAEDYGTIGRHYREPDQFQHPSVVSLEYVGEQEVVAIKTTTGTYVAEGLASHNCCRWILERGMFTSQAMMDELGDVSMGFVRNWAKTPVVVGIDPARKTDSTVVTVLWVDWDRPDEFGYYDHRILNWLEIQGDDWEEQYAKIVDFLANYNVLSVAVDANGVGDAVAQRLRLLLPRAEVHSVTSSAVEQSKRFKHLSTLMERRLIGWPAHANARRTRIWRKFQQQMLDAEKQYKGVNFTVSAPDEAWAHDDFVDSLALAAVLTADLSMPSVEVSVNPFFSGR